MIALNTLRFPDRSRIQQALEHQDINTIDEVVDRVESGEYLLLRHDETSMTVMLEPDGLHVNQMGGKLKDIPEFIESLSRIAKDHDKRYITLEGRRGWSRVLIPYGFVAQGNRMRLAI